AAPARHAGPPSRRRPAERPGRAGITSRGGRRRCWRGAPGCGCGPAVTEQRIAYVVGTTTGGTGRHVAMLAEQCAARGLAVAVFGPESTESLFPGVPFGAVNIGSRPRPGRDAAAVRRLRGLLADCDPDVVHAHGLRAGAAAALALRRAGRGRRGRRPALQV